MKIPGNIARAARGMAAIAAAASSEAERAALAYFALYACGYSGRGSPEKFSQLGSALLDFTFIQHLNDKVRDLANYPGWRVTGWDSKCVFLEKEGIRTYVGLSRFKRSDLVVGRSASVSLPALMPGRLPGFVVRESSDAILDDSISRFYLNIRPSGAARVLGPLARTLDRAGIPYVLKVLAHPRAYLRRDAGVLYVSSEQVGETFERVRRSLLRTPAATQAPVPLFTRKLAPGIGFADQPSPRGAEGPSHGQWVSRLFLEAASKTDDPREVGREVVQAVIAEGRDPDHPYLRPGRSPSALKI